MIIYGKKTIADFAKCKKNINFGVRNCRMPFRTAASNYPLHNFNTRQTASH